MYLLHFSGVTVSRSKLDDLELEFLNDPANAHLFPVLEDPEIPEPEPEPAPQPESEPQPEPAPQPKPAKKRKNAAKAGGGDAATTCKKKEPELV